MSTPHPRQAQVHTAGGPIPYGQSVPGQPSRCLGDETAVLRGPVLHAPPAPGHGAGDADLGPGGPDPVAVSVRNQALTRMVALNANHAKAAWQSPGAPVCPHAVAFLYLDQPDPASSWRKVVAATRVVPDTSDVRELPTLLFRLTRLARERYLPTQGGFDPAVHMSVYHDDATGAARYIGLGVSTLDTLAVPWERACRDAEDIDDLGGRAFALLADHTALLVDRPPARRGRGELGVHATRELNYATDYAPRMWTRHCDVSTMTAAREVWELMYELHTLIYEQNPRPTL